VLFFLFCELCIMSGLFGSGGSFLAGDLLIESLLGKASFFSSSGFLVGN